MHSYDVCPMIRYATLIIAMFPVCSDMCASVLILIIRIETDADLCAFMYAVRIIHDAALEFVGQGELNENRNLSIVIFIRANVLESQNE